MLQCLHMSVSLKGSTCTYQLLPALRSSARARWQRWAAAGCHVRQSACTTACSSISCQTGRPNLSASRPCKRSAWWRDGRSRCRAGAACGQPSRSHHAAESMRNNQEAAALQRPGCRLTAAGRRQQRRRQQCWQRLAGYRGHCVPRKNRAGKQGVTELLHRLARQQSAGQSTLTQNPCVPSCCRQSVVPHYAPPCWRQA